MKALVSLMAVLLLALIAYAGASVPGLRHHFGVVIPYAAFAVFVVGMVVRVLKWASSTVPFRIPTTTGQQKSLPWIKDSKIESPSTGLGVIVRMALEVLAFRSLFRNLKTQVGDGKQVAYGEAKWLWAAGLAFHWSFLIILVRHMRFFIEQVPAAIQLAEGLDSFLQIGAPLFYMTDAIILASVTYLFIRRVGIPQVKYISLMADYFPLFLILGIAATGVIMRHFLKVDIMGVKQLTIGLVTFRPAVPAGVGPIFYAHVALVCALFVYFPWSKLVHMAGVFLSPTRNLANNNRMRRHVNPWNPKVEPHTYAECSLERRLDKLEFAHGSAGNLTHLGGFSQHNYDGRRVVRAPRQDRRMPHRLLDRLVKAGIRGDRI